MTRGLAIPAALLALAAAAADARQSPPAAPPLAEAAADADVEPTPATVESSSERVEVRATRAKDAVEAGERVEIELAVRASGDVRDRRDWRFESADGSARPTSLGAFDVIALPRLAPEDPREGDLLKGTLVLLVLDPGTQRPAPLVARWRDEDGEHSIEIALPSIEVTSALGDEIDPAKHRDILGEIEIRSPLDLWPYAAGAIGAIGLGALLWRLLRRAPRPVTADAWALAELARLERSALPAAGEYRAFYDALTSIARGYVVRRFAIPADRQTTREFIESAAAHADFPAAERPRLAALLALADLVKFADATPDARECAGHLEDARGFVERTRAIAEGEGVAR